jgi:PAS domain S-box-containing protein
MHFLYKASKFLDAEFYGGSCIIADIRKNKFKVGVNDAVVWIAIVSLFYVISLKNFPLFHILIEAFTIYIAYTVFLIIWKSRAHLENRYLIILGIGYFFVGTVEFLHVLAFKRIEMFPGFGENLNFQFWLVARYLESISFLAAPLFLIYSKEKQENTSTPKNSFFAWKVFLAYAIITILFLLPIFFFSNFLNFYIENLGLARFEIVNDYLICFLLLCSLALLYKCRDRFEKKVLSLLSLSIVLMILGVLLFTFYIHIDENPSALALFIKFLSFYLVYKAVVDIGFEEPLSLLFRELRIREENTQQKAFFLEDEYAHICKMIGVNKNRVKYKSENSHNEYNMDSSRSFIHNFPGIEFQFDRNFKLTAVHGSVEEMTGYRGEDFLSGKIDWMKIIEPEDLPLISEKLEKIKLNPKFVIENEFRIHSLDGETKWVREIVQKVPANSGDSEQFQGLLYDITERKRAEEALKQIDKIRIKEIHHRIKNNLQVISSLLSLQAEKFKDKEVLEAFRESQNRVASIAIIHEELHEGESMDTLDFAEYLRKLTPDLFSSYRIRDDNINLRLDLEQVYLGMDTAIPLGIVVNEIVSNALKHAFPQGRAGEIYIKFSKNEHFTEEDISSQNEKYSEEKAFPYLLIVADNGKGIPKEIGFQNANSLGLQLINILIEQIDGHIELKRDNGTEYIIQFSNKRE